MHATDTDEVLALLDVRESEAVPAWLGERLAARVTDARVRVLRVHPARAARIKGAAAVEAFAVAEDVVEGNPLPVGDDATLAGVLRSKAPMLARGPGEPRCLVPFAASGQVRQVLEFSGADALQGAEALVAVATKYYERLVEGETDPLTHLANRRLFHAHVDAGLRRWTCSRRAYYLAMLDLDHFKRVNDEFGHLYGDEILVHFANLMRATFRSGDQLYRFGGEEFVVVFGVEPPEHGGEATLERFRRAVEAYDFPGVGKVTVSIGFARVSDSSTPVATLIDRADEALYYAKGNGRNKVFGWSSLVESGLLKPRAAPPGEVTLF